MSNPPDFSKITIVAGGTVHHALTAGRMITVFHGGMNLVLAPERHRVEAFAWAADLTEEGPGYTVLFDDETLAAIDRRLRDRRLPVYDADNGDQPAPTQITVTAAPDTVVATEHGSLTVTPILAGSLTDGDVYINGMVDPDGDLMLFEAVGGYDANLAGVSERRFASADQHVAVEYGDDQLLHRVHRYEIPKLRKIVTGARAAAAAVVNALT